MPSSALHIGDALTVLRTLPAGSARCCVTSPPYFGLRDYGVDGQIGLETTLEGYIAQLVAVFAEVRRVLTDDGTLWLNLGDGYHNKQRHMAPARAALALQADGWWLRDEVVWHKPRTTPHPVKDRTVSAHEMVYTFSKRERYFYDYLAIEEPAAYPGLVRNVRSAFRLQHGEQVEDGRKYANTKGARENVVVRDTRRARSVWSISPQPYLEAHFATMPPALAERCIKAGSAIGDVVLDPFGGAGTTGLAAVRLNRHFCLIDLKPEYVALADRRIGEALI